MDSSNEGDLDMLKLAMGSSNHLSAQDSFTMFPQEILSLVCGLLPKETLKRVRQVSKIWERAAVPYLFDEIFISQDMADFRIAKLVIYHFRYYIRTLVFSSIYYRKLDRTSFRGQFMPNFYFDMNDDLSTDHCDYAFTVYRTMRNKQQESIAEGTSSAYLSFALTSLPNIRKIILTNTSSSRSMPYESLQAYQPRKLKPCPVKNCKGTPADHVPDAARETGFLRKGSTNPWRLVLSALSTTKANVRELAMESDDLCYGTDSAAFSMSPWGLSQATLSFQNLTKLRLSLIVDTEQFANDVHTCHVHRNVANLLSNAINLESLSLDLSEKGTVFSSSHLLFQDILGQCKFPKLRSLILASFTSSDEQLLRLLNHSRRLVRITINCFTLASGSWMRVADWIRASLPLLKHAHLNQLYGGLHKLLARDEYLDLYGDINDFLFASGENPFTKKALEKYLADHVAGREVSNIDAWLGYVRTYNEYY